MWLDLLRHLGQFTVTIAALSWLVRTIAVHWLSKDIDRYRAGLRAAHDSELENLRNELRMRSIEHEVRFRSIYERQAQVLAETYASLYHVYAAVSSYVAILEFSNEPSKEDKLKAVADSYSAFRLQFYPNKIFLPRETGEQVMRVADKLASITNVFSRGQRREASRTPPQDEDYWSVTCDRMRNEVPPLMEQLEAEFQRIFGVYNSREGDGEKKDA